MKLDKHIVSHPDNQGELIYWVETDHSAVRFTETELRELYKLLKEEFNNGR